MTRQELEHRLAALLAERAELEQLGPGKFLVLVPLRDRLRLDNEIREVQQQLETMPHE